MEIFVLCEVAGERGCGWCVWYTCKVYHLALVWIRKQGHSKRMFKTINLLTYFKHLRYFWRTEFSDNCDAIIIYEFGWLINIRLDRWLRQYVVNYFNYFHRLLSFQWIWWQMNGSMYFIVLNNFTLNHHAWIMAANYKCKY